MVPCACCCVRVLRLCAVPVQPRAVPPTATNACAAATRATAREQLRLGTRAECLCYVVCMVCACLRILLLTLLSCMYLGNMCSTGANMVLTWYLHKSPRRHPTDTHPLPHFPLCKYMLFSDVRCLNTYCMHVVLIYSIIPHSVKRGLKWGSCPTT